MSKYLDYNKGVILTLLRFSQMHQKIYRKTIYRKTIMSKDYHVKGIKVIKMSIKLLHIISKA